MLNSRTQDLAGKKFERLQIISFAGRNKDGRALWNCVCDCGKNKTIGAKSILNGDTKSCGCFNIDKLIERSTKHGEAGKKSQFYRMWKNFRGRCNNKNNSRYKDYGERGITYDKKWEDFSEFKKDMYFKYVFAKKKYKHEKTSPLSLERVDVNKGYNFKNCIFIPLKEQAGNTRRNIWFEAISPEGKRYTSKNQSEFAREHGLRQSNINMCLTGSRKQHKGWKFYLIKKTKT
jgi:hypothetical protein